MSRTLPKSSIAFRLAVLTLLIAAPASGSRAQEHGAAPAELGSGAGVNSAGADSGAVREGDRHAPPPNATPGGSAAGLGGIDLVTPEGSRGNLRRRVAPKAPAGPVPPGVAGIARVGVHPLPAAGVDAIHASAQRGRNAVGVATGGTGESGHHASGAVAPVPAGAAGQIAVVPLVPHHPDQGVLRSMTVGGVNGTNFGRASAGGIGGPATVRSGIDGTALRPKH